MKQTIKITALCIFILMFLSSNEAASGTIDFRELEGEILIELNLARTTPRFYVSFLQELEKFFYGKELRRPGEIPLSTKEGQTALNEAIRFMKKATPVPKLRWSEGMARGARDHVEAQGNTGTVGHGSAERDGLRERIRLYGAWEKIVGENIVYGHTRARDVIISLIIDDGVPHRGHRQNIFNPNFLVAGVACGPHPVYHSMCVMIFAGGYREKKQ
jgi:hypothetical protein